MEQKEIRLNADKRKSLVIDFRKHCESLDTEEKEAFKQSRDDAKSTIDSSFAICKEVVERRFPLEDVATLQSLQKKHNTINAVGFIDKQILPLDDAWFVEYRYDWRAEEQNRYHLVNKLKGVDQTITREQAQTPEQIDADHSWRTIDTTQAKELAITLGLAS